MKSHLVNLFAIISSFFVITSVYANSHCNLLPLRLLNSYAFYGELRPHYKANYETVYTRQKGGPERVKELLSQGYTCRRATAYMTKCQKVSDLKELPGWVKGKLESQFADTKITFLNPFKSRDLLFCGEVAAGWRYHQDVQFQNIFYPHFELHKSLALENPKLYLKDPEHNRIKASFIIIDNNTLSLQQEIKKSSKMKWVRYGVNVVFSH